jgi:hypothetical protein
MWTQDELERIGRAEELRLESERPDGTHRSPVTMWVIRHDEDLYVRSVNGPGSSWFRAAQMRHRAHIRAGGVEHDVSLVETDDLTDEIDAAYRAKYGHYAARIIDSITTPLAQTATLKLVPASSGEEEQGP